MFARTPVAKAFRVWVLDVLEKMNQSNQQGILTSSLTLSTADDRKPLRSLVFAWSKAAGVHVDTCWPQVKAHFQLTRIDDLPTAWIPDALDFVQGKIDNLQKALPPATEANFTPAILAEYERDILNIEKTIEHLCTVMPLFLSPGSGMLMSEYNRNKELVEVARANVLAAKNACGTGYYMLQAARKVYAAMK